MTTTNTEQFQLTKLAMMAGLAEQAKKDPMTALGVAGGGLGVAHGLLSKNDEDDYGERPISKVLRNAAQGGVSGILAGYLGTHGGAALKQYLENRTAQA